jgi:hypothetical protein
MILNGEEKTSRQLISLTYLIDNYIIVMIRSFMRFPNITPPKKRKENNQDFKTTKEFRPWTALHLLPVCREFDAVCFNCRSVLIQVSSKHAQVRQCLPTYRLMGQGILRGIRSWDSNPRLRKPQPLTDSYTLRELEHLVS